MIFFQKVHFIQICSVTQNTVFQYVKNIFLLSQKKLIFFTELNLIMPIYHTPLQLRLILSFRRYKCLFSISSFDCCVVHNPTVFLRGYKSTPNVFIFGHLYQVNTREFFTSEQGPGSMSITEAICLTHRKVGRDVPHRDCTNIEQFRHNKLNTEV